MNRSDNPNRSMNRPRNARPAADPQVAADAFNEAHPVGTRMRYWKGLRQGEPTGHAIVRAPASVMGGSAVVWLEGVSGCVALSHVERAAPGEPDAEVSRKGEAPVGG